MLLLLPRIHNKNVTPKGKINRLGSAGGKTTVSLAQVSLVEASKGVRFPLRPKGLVPPGIPGQGSAIPRERRGENCFRGGLLKGCALRVCTIPPPLSPFCRPPPPPRLLPPSLVLNPTEEGVGVQKKRQNNL